MPELFQVPVWSDNYAYLVREGGRAVVVDPSEAAPVLARVAELSVELVAVLNTHHHPDHVGGNEELRAATGCEIIGPAHDSRRIPGFTRGAVPGDPLEVAGLRFRVLDVRAHTRSHVTYVLDEPLARVVRHGHGGEPVDVTRLAGRPAMFCGDTLFLAGCGRLFEGTASDLLSALSVLAREPGETLVCCGHEYTEANLKFAAHATPENDAVRRRQIELPSERELSGSSVPDLLERELVTNPFLLCLDDAWRPKLAERFTLERDADAVAVLGAVRRAKDGF